MKPALLFLLAALCAAPALGQTSKASAKRLRVSKTQSARKISSAARRPVTESRWEGESISLDLKDADLPDVIRTFAELTGLNIVIDPDVRGSVTVRLHEVPWDQAFDLIVRSNGFGYVLEGNILRVGTVSKLTAQP